jgi:hypothetical protein
MNLDASDKAEIDEAEYPDWLNTTTTTTTDRSDQTMKTVFKAIEVFES